MVALRKLANRFIDYMASNMGLLIIPTRRMDSYLLQMRLKRIISEYRIDCVIDVGANIGQYRDFLRN